MIFDFSLIAVSLWIAYIVFWSMFIIVDLIKDRKEEAKKKELNYKIDWTRKMKDKTLEVSYGRRKEF